MSHYLARAVKTVLTATTASNLWSTRATTAMEAIRGEFAYVQGEGNALVVYQSGRRVEWFTFAGGSANDMLSGHLARRLGITAQANDFSISFPDGIKLEDLETEIRALKAEAVAAEAVFDDDAIEAMKFHECLPPGLRQEVLRRRTVNRDVLAAVLGGATRTVFAGS